MTSPIIKIGLIDPKSPTNVGAVLRAAGCFGVDEVLYTGQRFERARRFHTDTKDNILNIPLTGVDQLSDVLPPTMHLVCVELVVGAQALPEFKHPENAIYVFGPEDGTISQELIDKADSVVYIPTRGCLNLAATVNVVLYDRLAKTQESTYGDDLILASRDRNNRTQV